MKKIVTIIGTRPQIIKAAAISRAIETNFKHRLEEIIVNTGQHYDDNMSKVFFEEMNIPFPNYNLNAGSGSHAKQTAIMMTGIDEILNNEKPDIVLLYGDTNSTIAGALVASKLHIPIAHVEAGLRSYNKVMPEEINRIFCDHVSTLLFSPTETGCENLKKEGFKESTIAPYSKNNPKIYHCGDVMYDNALYFRDIAKQKSKINTELGIEENEFILVTIHRDSNTDNSQKLTNIFEALIEIAEKHSIKLVLPLHPRTSKLLSVNLESPFYNIIKNNKYFKIISPVSYLDMIQLESSARMIITDSGGVQKEAFFYKKPCIILRPETEWVEIVENKAAIIADADKNRIISALTCFKDMNFPQIFGDGNAADFICEELCKL